MRQTNCLNCGQSLEPEQNFCSNCSQSANTHRLTLPHILHEIFHAFTHADKGILYLVKGLATRPGYVAKEYIEGKRKKYYNPFTMLLICLGFFVFMGSFFHSFSTYLKVDPNILKRIPTEQGRQKYIARLQKASKFTHYIEKYSNIVALISTPVMALIFFACFYKKEYNYAEHLVANVFFAAFYGIITTIVILPVMGLTKGGKWYGMIVIGNFVLHALYFSWGYYQLMGFRKKIHFLRIFLIAMLSILVWVIISTAVNILYTMFG
ncbi:MAG: DUF3667 domain-containing protein [Dyadobacter sp.]